MKELELKDYQKQCKELYALLHPSLVRFHPAIIASVFLNTINDMAECSGDKDIAIDDAISVLNSCKGASK